MLVLTHSLSKKVLHLNWLPRRWTLGILRKSDKGGAEHENQNSAFGTVQTLYRLKYSKHPPATAL